MSVKLPNRLGWMSPRDVMAWNGYESMSELNVLPVKNVTVILSNKTYDPDDDPRNWPVGDFEARVIRAEHMRLWIIGITGFYEA